MHDWKMTDVMRVNWKFEKPVLLKPVTGNRFKLMCTIEVSDMIRRTLYLIRLTYHIITLHTFRVRDTTNA